MFRLTTDPIDPAALREAAGNPHAGAVSIFEGTVRNHHQGREVLRLEYEAHAPVAEKEGQRIVRNAIERFGLDHAEAVHRTGPLEIGESAVIVAVSSPHRSESFEACRFIIDEIKHRLPIWKKEFYPDGSSDWVGCEGCRQGHQH
ncbi:MAG: molybdenum cofactor biosynthesis protein MoaE [Verrucomicrobiota bacterium]|jgi:molybdopterin synthase catalytic subunit|nr:molybdenum cofactor biosynthesis protein MoaE [Verrucomicrobiota bacterium]MED5419367.1 molybdenum cofactor biosynthesis protein MoaE [Verrucomicrobiota bacterium]MEE2735043.1 molybdenum cofactor biosynthesis protein MoaE [Verrucomicrobiota bacterium]